MSIHPSLNSHGLSLISNTMTESEKTSQSRILDYLSQAETSSTAEIAHVSSRLIEGIRSSSAGALTVESLLREYSLSEKEGILLMCLAESLLRVPDALTANRLISDKLRTGDWDEYLGQGDHWLINASSWGLFLTGRFLSFGESERKRARDNLLKMLRKGGEPLIRSSVKIAMGIMGKQFVLGETLVKAFKAANSWESKGYNYSFDMLGEGARTQRDADHYFAAYRDAIHRIGSRAGEAGPEVESGISIKLSAIHPRYQASNRQRVHTELLPRIIELVYLAKQYNIHLTIDAEEADRLVLSLELIERVMLEADLGDWSGFGLAIQAYNRSAMYVIDFIADLAKRAGRKMMVRLVKGAYWDYEIKHAQEGGFKTFPVFTRKEATDVSYQACAIHLLSLRDHVFPQFATHNSNTVATIMSIAGDSKGYEFQRLHGMGESLYDELLNRIGYQGHVRIYAPVGEHVHLLAYLVRRLLENGANSSFVNKVADPEVPVSSLTTDAVALWRGHDDVQHPLIATPKDIFANRVNSDGWDLEASEDLAQATSKLSDFGTWAQSALDFAGAGEDYLISNPTHLAQALGKTNLMTAEQCEDALLKLDNVAWSGLSAAARAERIDKLADLLEEHKPQLAALLVKEAGKLLTDADAEVREAVDFCRYYAIDAQQYDAAPRGSIMCISPWNFPLAIFLGQITAALVAGNTVIAKPAEQTAAIANYALALCRDAGIDQATLQLIISDGPTAGNALLGKAEVKGVMFTGSNPTAEHISATLRKRAGEQPLFVAETGGQNAMVVDSTALPEQVVDDIISSGFQSAGQRCSALRVLYLQEDVAENIIDMIKGAMAELVIGDPENISTDVGPVIDAAAYDRLNAHFEVMKKTAICHYQCELPAGLDGLFIAPTLYEINDITDLKQEVFGPVVHIVRYKAADFDSVFERINDTGFGLTMGIHSRIDSHVLKAVKLSKAGNIYVNRNIIGAIVGSQPFGGAGLSGTGPKAGGPSYVKRLKAPEIMLPADINYDVGACTDASPFAPVDADRRMGMLPISLQAPYSDMLNELVSPVALPGPTGEENTIGRRERGYVWIDPNVPAEQVDRLAALALLAGNRVVIANREALGWDCSEFIDAGYLSFEVVIDYEAHQAALSSGRFDVFVMANDSDLRSHARTASGAIPTIIDVADEREQFERLTREVTVSINTTAAGGNATLMAAMD